MSGKDQALWSVGKLQFILCGRLALLGTETTRITVMCPSHPGCALVAAARSRDLDIKHVPG